MAETGLSRNLSLNDGLSYPASVGLVMVLSVGDLLSIVGNILVLVAVIGNPKLQTNTNFFIMNLSIIDLLAGVLLVPLVVDSLLSKEIRTGPLCDFLAFVDSVYATASSLTIACIGMDRYHSIVNCLHYEYIVTQKRTALAIAWSWFQSIIMALCPIAGWGNYTFLRYQYKCSLAVPDEYGFLYFKLITCIVVPYAVTVFCYTRIHLVARRHAKNMVRIHIHDTGKRIRRSYSSRKTKLVYLVVGLYTICWIPIYSLNVMQTIQPSKAVPRIFEIICTVLALLNGSFNPLVYALITTHYRAGLVRVYRRLRRKFGKPITPGQDPSKSSYSFSRSASSLYRFLAEREAMGIELRRTRSSSNQRGDSNSVSNSRQSSAGERARRQASSTQTLTVPDDRRSKAKLSSAKSNGVISVLPSVIPEENGRQLGCKNKSSEAHTLLGETEEDNVDVVHKDENNPTAKQSKSETLRDTGVRSDEKSCEEDGNLAEVKITENSNSKIDKVSSKVCNTRLTDRKRSRGSRKLGNRDKKAMFDVKLAKEQTEFLMKDRKCSITNDGK